MRGAANFLSTALDGPRWMQRQAGRQAGKLQPRFLIPCLPLRRDETRGRQGVRTLPSYLFKMATSIHDIQDDDFASQSQDAPGLCAKKHPSVIPFAFHDSCLKTAPCNTILAQSEAQNPPPYHSAIAASIEMEGVEM